MKIKFIWALLITAVLGQGLSATFIFPAKADRIKGRRDRIKGRRPIPAQNSTQDCMPCNSSCPDCVNCGGLVCCGSSC